MALLPATQTQIPDNSILDAFNKQAYLGNQFSYAASLAIGATTETALFYIANPASAGGYKSLFVNLVKLCPITASTSAIIRVYLNPTLSGNGTAKTPSNMRPASTTTSGATFAQSPTASSNGTFVDLTACAALTSNVSRALTVLDPGQSMLVTVQVSTNPTTINATLGWYEL